MRPGTREVFVKGDHLPPTFADRRLNFRSAKVRVAGGMLLPRTLSGLLEKAVKGFPAVLVTGPRQSGKTTLLRTHFGATHRYVSLEAPHVRGAGAR